MKYTIVTKPSRKLKAGDLVTMKGGERLYLILYFNDEVSIEIACLSSGVMSDVHECQLEPFQGKATISN